MKETAEPLNALDQYQLLEQQKRDLFKSLVEATDLSESDRAKIVSRIFEHSVEDGLDLSEEWVMDKTLITSAVTRDSFVAKHPEFSLRLANKLKEYRTYVDEENQELMNDFIDGISERVDDFSHPTHRRNPESKTPKIDATWLERIDNYYLNFIQLTKVKEQDPGVDLRTKGERFAEQALESDLKILEPHYYQAPIEKIIGKELHAEPGLFTQSDVDHILDIEKLSKEDEKVKKALKKARYAPLDVTYNIQHKEAKKQLKSELVESLKRRGYSEKDFELVKNEKTGRYEVVDKTGGNHEFNRENLRLVSEYPIKFEFTPQDPLYKMLLEDNESSYDIKIKEGESIFKRNELHVIDGEVYQQVNTTHNSYILIYPDGSRTESTYAMQYLIKTDKGLYYIANCFNNEVHGGNNFQWHRNGKRIYEHDDWDSSGGKLIEGKDGSTYWIAIQSGFSSQSSTRFAIFKDQQILCSSEWGEYIDDFQFVRGKLTYRVGKNIYDKREQYTLVHGDKSFGPYKKIFLINETDDLEFVYLNNDGESILYKDGVETIISKEGIPVGVRKSDDEILTQVIGNVTKGEEIPKFGEREYFITDQRGNRITSQSGAVQLFDSQSGRQVYLDENKLLHFGDKQKEIIGEYNIKPLGVINDDLFYLREKRNEKYISSFESGEINLVGYDSSACVTPLVDSCLFFSELNDGLNRVYEYTPEFILTAKEKRKIELLNILDSGSPDQIRKYFEREYSDETKKGLVEKIREAAEYSKSFAKNVGQMITESPSLFFDSIKAKDDDLTGRNIDEFISSIFPEVQTNHRRAIRKAKSDRYYYSKPNVGDYLSSSRESYDFLDGDPSSEAQLEILTLRQPVSEFISRGIYGSLKKGSSSWQKIPFQISENHIGNSRDITAEIKVQNGMKKIALPKSLNARIIPERVKGLMEDGAEIEVEITQNTLGEVSIEIPEGVVSILYSQEVQELPVLPPEINTKQYQSFRSDIERRFGKDSVEPIAKLPEELTIFIESISGLSPVEKAEEIESFVRNIGFYDFENGDVQDLKKYKGTEEVIAVMSKRMKEIKRLPKTPDKEKLEYKKYAGVCSDFAKLTTALLREAGIVSGMISGFQTDGVETVVTEKNAHAIAYAAFPAESGKVQIIGIDGTPNGLNDADEAMLSRIRQLSLKERREKFDEGKEKAQEDFEKRMKELEDVVSRLDDESIKNLQNGQLEGFLNTILAGVKESHVAVIDRILNASRYAGFDIKTIIKNEDLPTQIKFMTLIENEINSERKDEKSEDYFKGEKLFKTIEEFVVRYSRDNGVSGKNEALNIIEKVFDMSKRHLDSLEYRSAIAIVTYLKATKMS